jgi:hypothetical protein
MKNTKFTRIGVVVAGAAAVVGSVALAGTASAATAAPTVHEHIVFPSPGGVQPDHVSSFVTTYHDSNRWTANVRVDSGRSGAVTRCSDGSVRYGPAQGPGYWIFGGNCSGAGTLTAFGWYNQ